jgi:hypothetical protein
VRFVSKRGSFAPLKKWSKVAPLFHKESGKAFFLNVRVYRGKPGAQQYANYTPEELEECLEAIRSGTLSHQKEAKHFSIPAHNIK